MQTNIKYHLSFNHLAIQYNEMSLQAFGCFYLTCMILNHQ